MEGKGRLGVEARFDKNKKTDCHQDIGLRPRNTQGAQG